jgi:hypothetical protein
MAGEEDVVVEAATAAANNNNDMEEIREDAEDEGAPGEGLGNALPAARVKRIMRKNPDKKKNFSKDTVLAVSMATVSVSLSPSLYLSFSVFASLYLCLSPVLDLPLSVSCIICSLRLLVPLTHLSLSAFFASCAPLSSPFIAVHRRFLCSLVPSVQELFLDDMVKKSHEFTIQKRRKTMQLSDIGVFICIHTPTCTLTTYVYVYMYTCIRMYVTHRNLRVCVSGSRLHPSLLAIS